MTDEQWSQGDARCLGAHMSGRGLSERDERGAPVLDDDLVLLLNAHHDTVAFRLPNGNGAAWHALIDTDAADGVPAEASRAADSEYPLRGRSLVLLRRERAR